ncbi:hypothetical protein [Bradyrhizobium sp. WSM1253]|uniref:hypothetical protein n=1 Tax=Bradyrhizobium sp. WSM1253 TaxID=319003 RepID=UPI00025D138D|nr:hypothetical protein [Bradyrhizobium sp. WSM1253]EIG57037.1 hypothetical protein Bra1253DRAFT_01683 [Bradyrhizobium sp. WSM1253]
MTRRARETNFEISGAPLRRDEFDRNHRQIKAAIRPRDRVEDMYAEDLTDGSLQMPRLRRAASHFLATRQREVLYAQLVQHQPAMCDADHVTLVERWSRGEPDAKAEVAVILQQAGLTEFDIESEAVLNSLPTLIQLEQLQAPKAARRDKALLAIALHRRMQAQDQVLRLARDNNCNTGTLEGSSLEQPPSDDQ